MYMRTTRSITFLNFTLLLKPKLGEILEKSKVEVKVLLQPAGTKHFVGDSLSYVGTPFSSMRIPFL